MSGPGRILSALTLALSLSLGDAGSMRGPDLRFRPVAVLALGEPMAGLADRGPTPRRRSGSGGDR